MRREVSGIYRYCTSKLLLLSNL
uniref:Uncharacterized protein n=1 Tax=Anguilla anguilla TaxID=7936 RepID=A0A0E9PD25_ANGAN